MNLPRGYISYNQIRLYQNCPQKYYYTYIKEMKAPINEKIFLGIVFHSALEFYFNKRIEGSIPEIELMQDVFKEKYDTLQKEMDIVWNDSQKETWNRGIFFMKYFLKEMASEIQPLMVEKELEIDLPEIGIKLRGIIDLVEKDLSISDFKTTTAKWSKDKIKKSCLQMVIYKYLFEKFYGDVISELKFRIIYSKNPSNTKHQEYVIKSNDVDFERMFSVIKYVTDNISSGVYYKNEGYLCTYCEFKETCKLAI